MIRTLLITAVTAASLSMVNTASAQYMPPPMGTPSPTGGSGAAATSGTRSYGMNKGAIAAGIIGGGVAGGALLLRHHRHAMTACVGSDGTTLDDGKDVYTVVGNPLTPGERVIASGKKVKSDAGGPAFEVTSLRKDLGRCEQRQQTTASARK